MYSIHFIKFFLAILHVLPGWQDLHKNYLFTSSMTLYNPGSHWLIPAIKPQPHFDLILKNPSFQKQNIFRAQKHHQNSKTGHFHDQQTFLREE